MCGALDGIRHQHGPTPGGSLNRSKLMIVPRQRHMLPLEADTVVNDAVAELVQRGAAT